MIEVVKYSQIHDEHPIVELRRADVATLPLGKPVQIGHPCTHGSVHTEQ